MNTYIDLQEAADSLLKASDYLTEQAQCYTVIGERQHLDAYLNETENVRRREQAIEHMEKTLPESDALNALKDAMKESVDLMEREYYAMRLIKTKVRQINADLTQTADGLPPVSVSVGVSMCRSSENPQEMFHEADIALYYVKDHGRSNCSFYEPAMRSQVKI